MSAIQANAKSDVDHSCNWTCCLRCCDKSPEPGKLVRSPEIEDLAQRTDEVAQGVVMTIKNTPDNSVAVVEEDK